VVVGTAPDPAGLPAREGWWAEGGAGLASDIAVLDAGDGWASDTDGAATLSPRGSEAVLSA
jgi:hypothetical protein